MAIRPCGSNREEKAMTTYLYATFEKEIATFEAATKESFDGDFKKLAEWFELEGTKAASMENVRN